MPVNINLLSDDTIARGITPPDIGNFATAFTGTQDYLQKQALQNLFAGGLPRTPDGAVDWYKASEMALQATGAPGLPAAAAGAKFGILQDYFRNSGKDDLVNPAKPPQPDRTSALPDQERPDLPPSIQRTAATPRLDKNLGEITGVQRGPIEGNPGLFSYAAEAPPPEPFTGRFNASFDQSNEDPSLPPNARPMEGQQFAQNQPRPRIYIPGPGPDEATPQSPTGDIGRVPGQSQTSGGLEYSEENAQRLDMAAAKKFRRGEALDLLEKGAGASAKAEAEAYAARAKQIRDALGKNYELTPEEKAARGAGLSTLEMKRREEAGKLDVKQYQEDMTSINNGARNAAVGLQKAQLGKQITQQPDFISGPLSEYGTTFQQFRSIFGPDANAAMPNEAFNKITNDMLQEQIKSMGQSGVGRVLMSEVAIMQRALASLGITPVSNRALLEITSRAYRKALELSEITKDLPPNSQQLNKVVLGYLKKNQMFSDDERRNPALLGSKEPPPQAAQWSKQQVLQWGLQNGLKPGDPFMFNGQLRQIPQGQ